MINGCSVLFSYLLLVSKTSVVLISHDCLASVLCSYGSKDYRITLKGALTVTILNF